MGQAKPDKQNIEKYLHSLGLRTFTLPAGQKGPPPKQFFDIASNDSVLTHPTNNLGVATGTGTVVLDFDVNKTRIVKNETLAVNGLDALNEWDSILDLPQSLRVRTPSGGMHVYLATDTDVRNSASKIAPGVDVRGHHGYTVAPGSETPDGVYEIIHAPDQLAQAPDWVIKLCGRSRPKADQHPITEQDTPELITDAIDYLVDQAPEAVEGAGGDDTTFNVAARLKDLGISEPLANELLLEHWNFTKAFPAWEPEHLAKKVANAFSYTEEPPGSKTIEGEFPALPEEEVQRIEAQAAARAKADLEANRPTRDTPLLFRPWQEINLTNIPILDFVYSDFYARGYTSLTVAPPKVGKSMLTLAEAVDMATGRGFLTGKERAPQKVVYYNAEDDQDALNARVAAILTRYNIPQSEIANRLFAHSGVGEDPIFLIHGAEGKINEPLFQELETFLTQHDIDTLILDPLQDVSASPESNEVFRLLGQRMRGMAERCDVALGLVHHTRKIAPGQDGATMEDARGGSALRGTARFNRVLVGMSDTEAAKVGVENHRFYFRVADVEGNLAPPSASVNQWFEKVSIQTPNGANIGTIEAWRWPDALEDVTDAHAIRVRSIIEAMDEPPRERSNATSWAGVVIADVLGVDLGGEVGREKVKAVLGSWLSAGYLATEIGRDKRQGRDIKFVVCGPNDPTETVN